MTRIYVTEPDTDSDAYDEWDHPAQGPQRRAGFFTLESARYWRGRTEWDSNNHVDVNTRDYATSHHLYLTAQGRWVLNVYSKWPGVAETYSYIADDEARDWLVFNDCDDDAQMFFGEVEQERGPGRPEIGVAVSLRLGDALPLLDEYAAANKLSRAEANRRLIHKALA